VKELRRLFPDADRDILEDVIAGIAMSSEADLCLGDLLEQAVSRLLDVFADDPGIQCAFPKLFPLLAILEVLDNNLQLGKKRSELLWLAGRRERRAMLFLLKLPRTPRTWNFILLLSIH